MRVSEYIALKERVIQAGYVQDIQWAENVKPPCNAEALALEAIFVVLNSGMKNTTAMQIYQRVVAALQGGQPVQTVFGHHGKVEAIEHIWQNRSRLLVEFRLALNKGDLQAVEWCRTLPWIGDITCWHLAKNLGVDCAKPDRWLCRVAAQSCETVEALCRRLAQATGDRVATVDMVLWRACAAGLYKPPHLEENGQARRHG